MPNRPYPPNLKSNISLFLIPPRVPSNQKIHNLFFIKFTSGQPTHTSTTPTHIHTPSNFTSFNSILLANSAMEAASHTCCRIDSLPRSLASNDCSTRFTAGRRSFPSIVRVKRRNGVTRAVATEPKPKAADPRTSRTVNGSSINGTSTVH